MAFGHRDMEFHENRIIFQNDDILCIRHFEFRNSIFLFPNLIQGRYEPPDMKFREIINRFISQV